jgi:hypothetical protein
MFVRGIAVAAALAALTAPSALAERFITDTLAPGGPSGPSYRFVTDTLALGGGSASESTRFITDTLAPGGGRIATTPTVDDFDWSDAGIGAGASAGLLLVLLGGTRVLLRRRVAVA